LKWKTHNAAARKSMRRNQALFSESPINSTNLLLMIAFNWLIWMGLKYMSTRLVGIESAHQLSEFLTSIEPMIKRTLPSASSALHNNNNYNQQIGKNQDRSLL
jgi:hypothetical protein